MPFNILANGTIPDAIPVNESISYPLALSVLTHMNAVFLISGFIQNPNTHGSISFSDDLTHDTSQAIYDTAYKVYVAGGNIFDNCSGSSIDSSKWSTSGEVSEGSGAITLSINDSTSYITSDGASGLNMNSGTYYVLFDMGTQAQSNFQYFKVQLTNGTTTVDVYSHYSEAYNSRNVYLMSVNNSTNKANFYSKNGVNTWEHTVTDVDISTVTTNKYVRFYASNPADAYGYLYLYKICYYNSDLSNAVYSSMKTLSGTKTKALVSSGIYKNGSTTISNDAGLDVSLDNGSHYTTVLDSVMTSVTYSGTQMILKGTLQTNNNITPDELKWIVGIAD